MGILFDEKRVKIRSPRWPGTRRIDCHIKSEPLYRDSHGFSSITRWFMISICRKNNPRPRVKRGENVIGRLALRYIREDKKKKRKSFIAIDALTVSPSWRNLGAARALLTAVIDRCLYDYPKRDIYLVAWPIYDSVEKIVNGESVYISIPPSCTKRQLIRFYQSLGFVRYDQAEPNGEDASDPFLVYRWHKP